MSIFQYVFSYQVILLHETLHLWLPLSGFSCNVLKADVRLRTYGIVIVLDGISLVLTLFGLFHFIFISYHLNHTSFAHALFSFINFDKCLRISCQHSKSTPFLTYIHSPYLILFYFSVFHLIFISLGAKVKVTAAITPAPVTT